MTSYDRRPGVAVWEEGDHRDCGLIADGYEPVLNSILQVLFHVPGFGRHLVEDAVHRKTCKSLLNCVTCGMYRLYNAMQGQEVAKPNLFLSKFLGRSKLVASHIVNDLLVMLMDESLTRKGSYGSLLHKTLKDCGIRALLEGIRFCEGVCSTCGHKKISAPFYVTTLTEVPDVDFSRQVQRALLTESSISCPCGAPLTDLQIKSVSVPPYMFVNVSRNFEGPFNQSFTVKTEQRYLLSACVNNHQAFTFCPDKNIRLFEDGKVQCVTSRVLLRSTWAAKSLLLLYRMESSNCKAPKKVFMKRDTNHEAEGSQSNSSGANFLEMEETVEVEDCTPEPQGTETPATVSVKATQTCHQKLTNTGTPVSAEPPATKDAAVQVNFLDYERCSNSDNFKFMTGLSKESFEALYELIGGNECVSAVKFKYNLTTPKKGKKNEEDLKLNYRDRLFLFLLRLRRGFSIHDLAWMAGMSPSHTGEICYCLTRVLSETFKVIEQECFPSAALQSLTKPPQMFPFKNLRVMLDGVEFKIEMPSNFEMQGNTFSQYKAANTVRFIVGISCSGATIYVSPASEGHLSEKDAVLKSWLLQKLDKGDLVMTDRGFDLVAELQAVGAIQIKPPNRRNNRTLTPEEETLTKAIAPIRIYTEHAMAEIKDNRLLQGTIPLSLYSMLPDLVFIAAYLRNFAPTRIIKKSFRNTVDEEAV